MKKIGRRIEIVPSSPSHFLCSLPSITKIMSSDSNKLTKNLSPAPGNKNCGSENTKALSFESNKSTRNPSPVSGNKSDEGKNAKALSSESNTSTMTPSPAPGNKSGKGKNAKAPKKKKKSMTPLKPIFRKHSSPKKPKSTKTVGHDAFSFAIMGSVLEFFYLKKTIYERPERVL